MIRPIAWSRGPALRRGFNRDNDRRAETRKTRPIIIDKVGCSNASQAKEESM